ncbi:MAG: hypothetical protein Q9168_006663 [Polycauliona sp. 1 TL-2023]
MATPTQSEATPDFPSAGPPCETCKQPDMSNMSWDDGTKNFFSLLFAAPRMWPIGYIMNDSYSPLRVERDMPAKNWRDAFEDLLALENGREMISPQKRKAEDEFVARWRFEHASFSIQQCNHNLHENKKWEESVRVARQRAVKYKDHDVVETTTNDLLPWIQSQNDYQITRAQQVKASYDLCQSWTASRLKAYGHWIASLMDSGTLPGWKWSMGNSADGAVMSFGKRNSPGHVDDAGISMSELELQQIFEQGQPHGFGSPAWLPPAAIRALRDGTYDPQYEDLPNDPNKKFRPSASSILLQQAECNLVKLPDGSTVPSVKVENLLADGTTETKHFVQDSAGLLKEVMDAQTSMGMMREAVLSMFGGPSDALKRAHKIIVEDRYREALQQPED